MASNQIYRCMQYDMRTLKPILNRMYYCVDSRCLYKDNGHTISGRTRFPAVILSTELERTNSIKPSIGKFYYVEETNSLWLYDTRWVLKIGSGVKYNAYTADGVYGNQYLSQVINTDTNITGDNGDKILDNNGLLGNGTVAIRDSSRIIRSTIEADLAKRQTVFKSQLNNGMLFIPDNTLPYTDLSQSFGALHLTHEKQYIGDSAQKITGQAHYYGTWNNYGDINVIEKIDTNGLLDPGYIPNSSDEICKIHIKCRKNQTIIIDNEEQKKLVTTYITIRPLSDTQAVAQILQVYDDDDKSIVKNDLGELLYTNESVLLDNTEVECEREIIVEKNKTTCNYKISNYGIGGIIISIVKIDNTNECIAPSEWSTTSIPISYYTELYRIKKVLTSDASEANSQYIRIIK